MAGQILDDYGFADKASEHLVESARRVAEAQVNLERVRSVYNEFLSSVFSHIERISERPDVIDALPTFMARLALFNNYQRRALSRRRSAIRDFEAVLEREFDNDGCAVKARCAKEGRLSNERATSLGHA